MAWIQSDVNYIPQPYIPCEWSTGTDAEIVEALQKHYAGDIDITEYWSVGDIRNITIDATEWDSSASMYGPEQTMALTLSNVGGKTLSDGITECAFQVELNPYYASYSSVPYLASQGWENDPRRTWCNNILYNAIPSGIRTIFKEHINHTYWKQYYYSSVSDSYTQDYFAIRSEHEILGTQTYCNFNEGDQIDYYKISSNRVKRIRDGGTINGSDKVNWWVRGGRINNSSSDQAEYIYISIGGDIQKTTSRFIECYLAPFGVI